LDKGETTMKKLFVHLSLLCLLVALVVPMVGCKKAEETPEETTVAESDYEEPADTEPADTGMDTGMDTGSEPAAETPPAE
jgi:hypothetical protein